jgi:hypothetical protein
MKESKYRLDRQMPMESKMSDFRADDLVSLVYISAARDDLLSADFANILRESRQRNSTLDVTGLLLYADSCFMQALEGSSKSVDLVFDVIQKDLRHTRLATCSYRHINSRQFTDWTMAFLEKKELSEEHQLELSYSLSKWRTSPLPVSAASEAVALIDEFCSTLWPIGPSAPRPSA